MKRVVFCTKECWPGVKRCLDSMAIIVKSLKEDILITKYEVPNRFDGSFINLIRSNNPPDLLILGGYDQSMKNIIINSNMSKTKVFLEWCSPLSQIELGGEIPLFIDVMNFVKIGMISYISVLLDTDYQILKRTNNRFVYCPVYTDFSELDKKKKTYTKMENVLDCDIFCAANPRKNIFNQVFALGGFDLRTNVNFTRPEYIETCKRFLKKPVFHGWMDRDKYLSVLQRMDFGMQVSFSEAFNITVAEHFYYNKPVICSSFYPYFKGKKEISDFLIDDPSNCVDIYNKIKKTIESKEMRDDFAEIGKKLILEKNKENKDILVGLFSTILGV